MQQTRACLALPARERLVLSAKSSLVSAANLQTSCETRNSSEAEQLEKWRCLLCKIRTHFKGSPDPSPQEEGHDVEKSLILQGESKGIERHSTPDCLGFPQGSRPAAHATGKPRHLSHDVARPSLCSGATSARTGTGSRVKKSPSLHRLDPAGANKEQAVLNEICGDL